MPSHYGKGMKKSGMTKKAKPAMGMAAKKKPAKKMQGRKKK